MSTDTASTDLALPSEAQPPSLKAQIVAMEHQFALAAPRGVEARQIVRDVLTAVSKNPDLLKCTPASVLGGAMTMAQLGLRVGVLGHGWLLPFWNKNAKWQDANGRDRYGAFEATLVIGYQGLAALAHRSGQIKSLAMRKVHEKDHFSIEYGINENLVHRPADGDRGPVTGYYAVVKFLPDGHSFYYLSKGEAEIYRDRYAMAKKKDGTIVGPWRDEFDGMALKTCVRQLSKLMPKGTDLAVALEVDDTVRLDITPNADPVHVSQHIEPAPAQSTVSIADEGSEPEADPWAADASQDGA